MIGKLNFQKKLAACAYEKGVSVLGLRQRVTLSRDPKTELLGDSLFVSRELWSCAQSLVQRSSYFVMTKVDAGCGA
jgi:hypothetical protein